MSTADTYCKVLVSQGRMGLFRCTYQANGDDGLCGIHRAAEARRQPMEPLPATAPAEVSVTDVETVRYVVTPEPHDGGTIHRSVTVRMTWPDGTGPSFKAPYASGLTIWYWLSVQRTGTGALEWDGRGAPRRKDGTPGDRLVDPRWLQRRDIPDDLAEALLGELERAEEREVHRG